MDVETVFAGGAAADAAEISSDDGWGSSGGDDLGGSSGADSVSDSGAYE
jgi:hypothetical protein